MIRDDKERVIGKLISINSERFVVELLNQSINFTINGFEDIYQYAQLNGYVILPYQDFYIVAEIFGVREKDSDNSWKGEKEQVLSKSNSVKYLDINPIGTIQKKGVKQSFRYGVSVFPTLYTDVLYIRKEELDVIFEVDKDEVDIIHGATAGTKLNHLHIGTSTIFPDYGINVDINGFFGAHSAVLGNTGSGKSCTISSMMQTLFKKDQYSACGASFIFFDVNGEYHKAFSQIENPDIEVKYYSIEDETKEVYEQKCNYDILSKVEYKKFRLPHWFLTIDEWALLLQTSEKTQLPVLRSGLGFSQNMDDISRKHIYASNIMYVFENWESPVAKRQRIMALIPKGNFNDIIVDGYNTQFGNFSGNQEETFKDSVRAHINDESFIFPKYENQKFEFSDLEHFLEDAILYEEYHGNKQIRDYSSSLITRFKSLRERSEFDFLKNSDDNIRVDELINDFLGLENGSKKTQVSIIDLNNVSDEVVEVASSVITRILFDYLKSIPTRNSFPINIVLEEAHRYISEYRNSTFGEANKIFERVSKEGRKYGMFLLVSSQRPSELSKTVLSQCSNFIVHRIQNPEDLSQIRQMTPHISANVLSRLPSIPKQHALIFGHSVQIPALFKVNNADPTPNSTDNDISTNWFIPKASREVEDQINIDDELI